MIITADKLVSDYYNQVKDKYPEISFERFEKICKLPFYYIRKKIGNMSFPLIHIKYLGKFLVYPGKVEAYLRGFKTKLDKKEMTKEEFDDSTKPLSDFLKKNPK